MLSPLLGAGRAFAGRADWPALAEYNALLDPPILLASGATLRFAPQGGKPACMEDGYEARIYLSGEIQTRTGNWHDFFNALVWVAFPRTKTALNACHFSALARGPATPNRAPARDALTLFDESGVAVVYADETLAELLRAFRWKELFHERRRAVREGMRFVVFGHSLHEKALQPYIGLTGKGLLLKTREDFFARSAGEQARALDDMMAERFTPGAQPDKGELTPVPLLGVPGWWQGNEEGTFYDNREYFRPRRINNR